MGAEKRQRRSTANRVSSERETAGFVSETTVSTSFLWTEPPALTSIGSDPGEADVSS